MLSNVKMCLENWRLIHLLGFSGLRMRYARSKLGQAWLTLSLFIQIISTGIVWTLLWHISPDQLLPYLALSQVIYQFFSSIILDSTSVFITDARLYTNQYLPFLTSIFSNIYKNIIIFLHNIPIILIVFLYFEVPFKLSLLSFFMLPVLMLFLLSSSFVIACLCTRYRDLVQIVQSIMNISFLITPIVWKLSYVPEQFRPYFFISPFTSFLEIFRNSLLGMDICLSAYLSVAIWTTIFVVLMIFFHRKYERKIVFWI